MMFYALTNAGKSIMPNNACARCQQNTKDSVFWLAQILLCIMTLSDIPHFIEPNVISDDLENKLSFILF